MIHYNGINLFSKAIVVLVTLVLSTFTYADLMISPTRVFLDDGDRTFEVNLINTGKQIRSYRVEWKQMAALQQGGYRELTEKEKSQYSSLERFVRISPKQVTLAPGGRQTVKLLVRKPSGLQTGEYRSHLSFVALPPSQSNSEKNAGSSISLNVLMSYTMPVIYRVGAVNVNPAITDISLVHKKETGITNIKVDLYHNDPFSSHGRLIAYWTPQNGPKRQVGLINGYNFYPETKTATTQFPWQDFKLEPGILEVRYEGQLEFKGLLLAQKTLPITQQMINSVK
ncbi:fimbrial biogenesis chaperone [Marinomonas fungiae]|uniref:Pili and flagellar-assembly chaperone, PapD N-terminal domain n=1 Tax=Marinomonas fungiae TaxID=1137284 RepID=A0A0K6IH78_9GAMM|nr:fimbria/pilus periplasmic chaperone [Marinomonas fungiae]CUB02500.1 Pili and flagellar-assembly chaperone, PapD N-terminal domain [Marinomonas fungiae]